MELLSVVLMLWLLTVIIFFNNSKSPINRWGALFTFLCSLGVVGRIMQFSVEPTLELLSKNYPFLSSGFSVVESLFHMAGLYYAPYALLKLGLAYSRLTLNKRCSHCLDVILHLPIVAMLIIFPVYPFKLYSPDYRIVSIWAVPYMLLAAIMIFRTVFYATTPAERRSKSLTAIIIGMTAVSCSIVNYIAPALGIQGLYFFNIIITTFALVAFVATAWFYEIFGIRIKFESAYKSSIEAVNSGTCIINHALKNEITKISVCQETIKLLVKDDPRIFQTLGYMNNATNALLTIVKRIQNQIKAQTINKSPFNIAELINESLTSCAPWVEQKQITVIKEFNQNITVNCDPIHLKETFNNLIINAIDAMEPEGILRIKLGLTRGFLLISFWDNGCGIPANQIHRVIEPFYSSKKFNNNFGLGLTYCYNVIKGHNGILEITSEQEQGTKITIKLPRSLMTKPK
jgi:signal transduction histidine kinase